jgi:hypothetical protein
MKAEGTGALFDVDNMLRVFEYSPNLGRRPWRRICPIFATL